MTIPARDVGRSETGHRPTFYDQVLQYFIERRAHVNIAIGERRTVVQNEKRIVFSRFLNLFVDFLRIPIGPEFLVPDRTGWPSLGTPSSADSMSLCSSFEGHGN